MIYKCKICGYIFDESAEGKLWNELPANWVCPLCGAPKELFEPEIEQGTSDVKPSAEENKSATVGLNASHTEEKSEANEDCKTASDVVAETLSNWGVKLVLGMVGHSNLGMGEAVRKLVERGKMRYIGIRHEGAAAFACSAYGKLTGRPAACISIAGPGATNLLTGLYDAKLDRAPAVALMGQVPSKDLGLNIFQETDLQTAFSDAAQSSQTMLASSDFAALGSEACRGAILNRGVSQIIMPDDIQVLNVSPDSPAGSPQGRIFPLLPQTSKADLTEAAKILGASKRPAILVGIGCEGAVAAVENLARTLKCPVFTTYRAKGLLPDSFEYACGVAGRSGTSVAQKFAAEADCIVGLGAGFSRRTAIPQNGAKIVQVDIDPRALGRLCRVDCAVLSDIRPFAEEIVPLLKKTEKDFAPEIADEWKKWRAEKSRRAQKSVDGALAPAEIAAALEEVVPDDAIVCVDVGNVAYSFGKYFEAKKQRFLLSWYLGSIGCGLPFAIGAWCAARENDGKFSGRKIVAVVGDGGLGQYLADWTTVVKNGMDIKCIVVDNSQLAKISREQENAKMRVWQTDLKNPDFSEYSKLCGGGGFRISKSSELKTKLRQAFDSDAPCMVDILADPDQM